MFWWGLCGYSYKIMSVKICSSINFMLMELDNIFFFMMDIHISLWYKWKTVPTPLDVQVWHGKVQDLTFPPDPGLEALKYLASEWYPLIAVLKCNKGWFGMISLILNLRFWFTFVTHHRAMVGRIDCLG